MTGSNRSDFEDLNQKKNKKKHINLNLSKKKKMSESSIVVDVLGKRKGHVSGSSSPSAKSTDTDSGSAFMLDVEETESLKDKKNKKKISTRSTFSIKEEENKDQYIEVSLVSPRNSENRIKNSYGLSDAEMSTIKLQFYRLNQIQIELHEYIKQDKIKSFHKKTRELLASIKEKIFYQHHQLISQVVLKEPKKVLDFSENQVSNLINQIQKGKSKSQFSIRTQNFFDKIQKINSLVPESQEMPLVELNQKLLLSSIEDIMSPLFEFSQPTSPIKNFDKKKNQYIGFEFIELFNQIKANIKTISDEETFSGSSWVYNEMIEKVFFILFKYGYIPYQEKAPKPMQLLIDRYIKKVERLESGLDIDSSGVSLSGKYSLKWRGGRKQQDRQKQGRDQIESNSLSDDYHSLSSPNMAKHKKGNDSDLSNNAKYQILFHSLLRTVDYYEKNLMGRMLSFETRIEENKKNHWTKQIRSISDFLTHAYLSNQHHAPDLLSHLTCVISEIRNSFGGKDSKLAGTLEDLLNDYHGNTYVRGEGLFTKPKLPSSLKVKSSSEEESILYVENQLIHKISKLILDYLDESDSRVFGSSNQFKIHAALFLNHVVHTIMGEFDLDARMNKLNQFLEGGLKIDSRASRAAQFKLGMNQLIQFSLSKHGLSSHVESLGNGKFHMMIQEFSKILEISECKSEFGFNIS